MPSSWILVVCHVLKQGFSTFWQLQASCELPNMSQYLICQFVKIITRYQIWLYKKMLIAIFLIYVRTDTNKAEIKFWSNISDSDLTYEIPYPIIWFPFSFSPTPPSPTGVLIPSVENLCIILYESFSAFCFFYF